MKNSTSPVSGTPSPAPAASPAVHTVSTAVSGAIPSTLGYSAAGALERVQHLSQPEASERTWRHITDRLNRIARGETVPASIIRKTTGAGKTTTTCESLATHPAVRAGLLHTVIVVRDHNQSADYHSKLTAGGLPATDVVIYRGRTDADPDRRPDRQEATACHMPDAVRAVGSKNHVPAATICQRCPIGLARGIHDLRQEIDDGTASEAPGQPTPEQRLQRLEQRYEDAIEGSRMDEAHVGRIVEAGGCFLHRALPAYRKAPVLIVPQQAFNESLCNAEDLMGEKLPSVVIADENLDLARERFTITGTRLDEWREAIAPLQQCGHIYDDAMHALRLIDEMRAKQGSEPGAIKAFLADYARLREQREVKRKKTAWWEQARWAGDGSGKLIAPLRAICDLGEALEGLSDKSNSGAAVTFQDDGIHVTTLTPLGERLLSGNTILLDATISDSTIAALRSACDPASAPEEGGQMRLDGIERAPTQKAKFDPRGEQGKEARKPTKIEVLDIQVPQHAQILHLDGRSYGRGLRGSEGYEARLRKTRHHLLAMILAARTAGTLEQTAFLGQKCAIDSDELRGMLRAHGISAQWIEKHLGWWGRDDRAHNRWAGLNVIIQSLPWRSPGALRQSWSTLRALDSSLPTEPPTRFAAEVVCADLVQAVGRARAIYADTQNPIRITIAARVPEELAKMLERHGLAIGEKRDNPLASRRMQFYDLAGIMQQALRTIGACGGSPTVLNLAAEIRAAGGRCSNETMLRFAEILLPVYERGPKRLGYGQHLIERYQRALDRWLRLAKPALERRADRAARAASAPLRQMIRKLLVSVGAWFGWEALPEVESRAGPPPDPLPAAA